LKELKMRMHNPPHPGRLIKEYLDGNTVQNAAERMGVSRVTLQRVINGKAGVSPAMAYRLGDLFSTSPDLWINLQKNYEMHIAGKEKRPHIEPITRKTAEHMASA